MPLATTFSRAGFSIHAPLITVETHLSNGLPALSIVGLPEAAVKESKDRVRSAILNAQLDFPAQRITINLAPADLPKGGGRFDLAIAIGILAASGQCPDNALEDYEFAGELSLSGSLRPIKGVVPMALKAKQANRSIIVPKENADEAALCQGLNVYAANHLLDVIGHLTQASPMQPHCHTESDKVDEFAVDFADVQGQSAAKRAFEIAAAGGHSLIMVGPPGTGKTMLASRLPSILPPLSDDESIEVSAINSLARTASAIQTHRQRPFRSPHHTASSVALVGGGSTPRPGEISLAHKGVLFLDELPEFNRHVIEVLREPMESGKITISRANSQMDFPAEFQLVAAMNPCPCGHHGDPHGQCRCTSEQVTRYQSKISGPLLDRIDLCIEVPRLKILPLPSQRPSSSATEGSQAILERVLKARERQKTRNQTSNARMSVKHIDQHCQLDVQTSHFFTHALESLKCSARVSHRLLKVARTIADLDSSEAIQRHHLAESLTYRNKLHR